MREMPHILESLWGLYLERQGFVYYLLSSNQEDLKMLQQAFEFQKTVCDSSFTIATSVQENCENIMKDMLELYPWLPAQGKKACMEYSEQYWLGLNKCRKASLSGIEYLEKLVTPTMQDEEKAAGKSAKEKPAPAKTSKQAEKSSTPAKAVTQ
jgi:hypothetical protein